MYIEIWSLIGIILILCIGALIGSIITVKMAQPTEKKEKVFLTDTGTKITFEEMSILYNEAVNKLDIVSEEYLKCIKELYLHNYCFNCLYFDCDECYCEALKTKISDDNDRPDFCLEWKFNPSSLSVIDGDNIQEVGAFVELDKVE